MFALELFGLKPGTFIKGIRIEKARPNGRNDVWGRIAYLNVSGWEGEMMDGMTEIRTPFYRSLVSVQTHSGKEATDIITNENYSSLLDYEEELDLGDIEWLSIKEHEPVGIHLGEFALLQDDVGTNVVVYSKILNVKGETGFIVLTCSATMTSELELI